MIDALKQRYQEARIDVVLGIEARGFIFAPALAYALGDRFRPGPQAEEAAGRSRRASSTSSNTASTAWRSTRTPSRRGQNVLIVDDVLATGGTAAAVAKLVEKLGGRVAGLGFVVELTFLNGRKKLAGHDVFSLLHYDK